MYILNVQCLQKRRVMVTSFSCCYAGGRGAIQSPNHWRSFKVQGKIEEGEMESDKGVMKEVEGV